MAVLEKPRPGAEALFIGAAQMNELRAIVARQFEELGIDYNPNVLPQDLRRSMVAARDTAGRKFSLPCIIEARDE